MRRFGLRSAPPVPAGARLLFLEEENDVRRAVQEDHFSRMDAVVALEPEAAWALHELDRPYVKLEDGYRESDLCDLAEQAIQEQVAWAQWADQELQNLVGDFRDENFLPFQLNLYWLKIMFDVLSIRAHTLRWALESWKPAHVTYVGNQPRNDEFGWDLMFAESLYPAVLREVAKTLGVGATLPQIPDVSGRPAKPIWPVRAEPSIRRRLMSSVRRGKERVRTLLAGGSLFVRASAVLGRGFDLDEVWMEDRGSDISLTSWNIMRDRFHRFKPGTGLRDRLKAAWSELTKNDRFRGIARCAGCDLWFLAKDRMDSWWQDIVPVQWTVHRAARARYKGRGPRVVVVPAVEDPVERALFVAFRSIGVPTAIYQHGGFIGSCVSPPWDCNDLYLADSLMTYGDGVTGYFEDREKRYAVARARALSVGSARLDALRVRMTVGPRRSEASRPVVLLVPHRIQKNNRYLECGNIPDVSEAEVQAELVAVGADFPGCDLVLKPFPGQLDTPAVLEAQRRGGNCRVETGLNLARLMPSADFIVLDFPSTALLEALLTDKPILVLCDSRSLRMTPSALEALMRRADVKQTPSEFVEAYRSRLARNDFQPVKATDQTFLRLFGTHRDDGKSAARVWEWIRSACKPVDA